MCTPGGYRPRATGLLRHRSHGRHRRARLWRHCRRVRCERLRGCRHGLCGYSGRGCSGGRCSRRGRRRGGDRCGHRRTRRSRGRRGSGRPSPLALFAVRAARPFVLVVRRRMLRLTAGCLFAGRRSAVGLFAVGLFARRRLVLGLFAGRRRLLLLGPFRACLFTRSLRVAGPAFSGAGGTPGVVGPGGRGGDADPSEEAH